MRLATGRQLSIREDWNQFKIHLNKLGLPTGQLVSPQQV